MAVNAEESRTHKHKPQQSSSLSHVAYCTKIQRVGNSLCLPIQEMKLIAYISPIPPFEKEQN